MRIVSPYETSLKLEIPDRRYCLPLPCSDKVLALQRNEGNEVSILYEVSLEFWCKTGIAFVSTNGYSLKREARFRVADATVGPWVLRNPNGEYVDRDYYRNSVTRRNGFRIMTSEGS